MASNLMHLWSAKSEAPKFNGKFEFSLWKTKMRTFLETQGLWKAVEETISYISVGSKFELMARALSYIFVSVTKMFCTELGLKIRHLVR